MPTYQYECRNCGYRLEELQLISEPPLTHCPNCKTDSLARIIGTGAGLIFKGSGFYATDYRSESYKKQKEKESGTKPKAKDEGKAKQVVAPLSLIVTAFELSLPKSTA